MLWNVLRPERRNGPIAFLLPRGDNNSSRITQPFYSQLFYRAEKECQKLGYTLVYSTLDETDHFDELVQANGCLLYTSPSPRDRG